MSFIVRDIQIPQNWKVIGQDKIISPYKVDVFPRQNSNDLEVWVIGGLLRNEAYQGFYNPNSRTTNMQFLKRDKDEQGRSSPGIKEISVGESGVWAVDGERNARYYDRATQRWLEIPDVNSNSLKWRTIESASQNNVYAIKLLENELYFRAGITDDNPRGTKWIKTGVRAFQVSSSPYITYIMSPNNELNSFTMLPTEDNIKTLVTSLKTHDVKIVNKLSVGFDNTLIYLDDINRLRERDKLSLDDEQFDSKWRWQTYDNIKLTDVSSSPILFGIMGNKIVIKQNGML